MTHKLYVITYKYPENSQKSKENPPEGYWIYRGFIDSSPPALRTYSSSFEYKTTTEPGKRSVLADIFICLDYAQDECVRIQDILKEHPKQHKLTFKVKELDTVIDDLKNRFPNKSI